MAAAAQAIPYTHVAYKVTEPDEDGAVIVHARNPMEARRLGSYEFSGMYDETSLEVERKPEFDGITGGEVLIRAQLDAGWWFTCGHCERRVTVDDEDDDDDEERPQPIRRHVVRRGTVFCSSACCIGYLRERRMFKVNEWETLREAVERWPGIEIDTVNGLTFSKTHPNTVVGSCYFRFPGGKHSVLWIRGEPLIELPAEDVPAWDAFKATLGAAS